MNAPFELPEAIGTPRIPLAWSFSALAQSPLPRAQRPLTAWPRLRDLPETERTAFAGWLADNGATCPEIPGEPDYEQDGYYAHDLDSWRHLRRCGMLNAA